MLRPTLVAAMLMTVFPLFAKRKADYLLAYSDSSSGQELYGYKTRTGRIAIPARFQSVNTDTLYRMAIVLDSFTWVGIDRRGKTMLVPFIYDNGPDYIEEGLFRFVEDCKVGFANAFGEKVVPARYSFAEPFHDGLAEYTQGGQKVYIDGGEHWIWVGGYAYGYLNRYGQEFKRAGNLKCGRRHAWTKQGRHVLLNKWGNIIHIFRDRQKK